MILTTFKQDVELVKMRLLRSGLSTGGRGRHSALTPATTQYELLLWTRSASVSPSAPSFRQHDDKHTYSVLTCFKRYATILQLHL